MKHAVIKLKVIPGSSRNELVGWMDDRLKIKVTAAPEKGKANKAVVKLLAEILCIHTRDVVITDGLTSQHKTIQIGDTSQQELVTILERVL